MKMVKLLCLVSAFILSTIPFARSTQAEEVKIGYIDITLLFDSYDKTKEEDAALSSKGDELKTDRDKRVEKIRNMRNELELLSEKEREKKQQEIDSQIRSLQDFEREAKTSLQRERDDMIRGILKEIDAAIEEYAQKQGYTVVLNSRALVYAPKEQDITQQVLNLLNSRYNKE